MKIAIVHEWLVTYAGSERVLAEMLKCIPEADLYSLVDFLPECERSFLMGKSVKTSFLQNMPLARKIFRHYLPLMPLAIEQFDLSAYDVVISSSHAVAKGVITGPNQIHICMCYSPIRYAWDMQHQYLSSMNIKNSFKKIVARIFLHYMRLWDVRTASGVDQFIAISKYIKKRIWKVYRRESTVIYPPVDIDRFEISAEKDDFYITASRFVPYKHIPLIIDAFRQLPDRHLIVIGDGPEFEQCKSTAPENVSLLGWQPTEVIIEKMQRASAFIFAAEEDFGIAPLEAQACGTPVIAFGRGGALETIRGIEFENPTGVFFYEQNADEIVSAIKRFEKMKTEISPEACRKNAEKFSSQVFQNEFKKFIYSTLAERNAEFDQA